MARLRAIWHCEIFDTTPAHLSTPGQSAVKWVLLLTLVSYITFSGSTKVAAQNVEWSARMPNSGMIGYTFLIPVSCPIRRSAK